MMNLVDIANQPGLQIIVDLILFIVLTAVGVFIFNKIRVSDNRYANPLEFLPEDEIHTLKQVFYLIMMSLCFVVVLYTLMPVDLHSFSIFDIGLSLFIAITLDKSSLKNKILLVILVPFGSLSYLLFNYTLMGVIDFIHVPVFLYFIKVYYDRFNNYTRSHGLSLAIILLFVIVFFSFFLTQLAEGTNPLDSLVMVSNAFTSNGYAVLGKSVPGKINSIFLVWGGYIISGATTASLTAAILIKHFNKRVSDLERIIDEGGDEQ
jgi:hypothetical protein